jgi:hypothetical protein
MPFIATVSGATEIQQLQSSGRGLPRASPRSQAYHDRIVAMLDARAAEGRRSVLIAMHSFTPVFKGVARPWQIGLLYNRDRRVADIMKDLLAGSGLTVGDNEPYAITDTSDYGIQIHGEQRAPAYRDRAAAGSDRHPGPREWADRLHRCSGSLRRLRAAWRRQDREICDDRSRKPDEQRSVAVDGLLVVTYSYGTGDEVLFCCEQQAQPALQYLRVRWCRSLNRLPGRNLRQARHRAIRQAHRSVALDHRALPTRSNRCARRSASGACLLGHIRRRLRIDYALKYPQALKSLVLSNTSADMPHMIELNRLRRALSSGRER